MTNRLAWWLAGMVALLASGTSAAAASCADQIGAAQADAMVRQCLAISTATHPPCNAANSCETIGGFIQQMCRNAGAQAPGWCRAYASAAVPKPLPSLPLPHPGFDCRKAATPVDREICAGGHDWIAQEDRAMSEIYLRAHAHAADPAALRAAQQEFLREREACAAPEHGPPRGPMDLAHCIGVLTHERLKELQRLTGADKEPAWSAFASPCEVSFGGDGWDQLNLLPRSATVQYVWLDQYDRVLRAGDTVTFDVDGRVFPARLLPDEDGQPQAVSTDPGLPQALRHGRMARVKRNGTVMLRAPLSGFDAAAAQAEHGCRPAPAQPRQ